MEHNYAIDNPEIQKSIFEFVSVSIWIQIFVQLVNAQIAGQSVAAKVYQ